MQTQYLDRLATASEILDGLKSTEVAQTMQNMITRVNNSLCMKSMNKKVLSTLNDKRYIFHDGILTLPAGHKALRPHPYLSLLSKISQQVSSSDSHKH